MAQDDPQGDPEDSSTARVRSSSDAGRSPGGRARRWRGFRSIRTPHRLGYALVGVVIVAMEALIISYAVVPTARLHDLAVGVQRVSLSAVELTSALGAERAAAMAYLAAPSPAMKTALGQQQAQTTSRLEAMQAAMRNTEGDAGRSSPEVATRMDAFVDALGGLPQQRAAITSGKADPRQVFGWYNGLLDSATALFDAQARNTPDSTLAQNAITAVHLFRDADTQARVGSLVAGALTAGKLSREDFDVVWNLIGFYHRDLQLQENQLLPAVRSQYRQMVTGSEFQRLTQAETLLIQHGPYDAVTDQQADEQTDQEIDTSSTTASTAAPAVSARSWVALAGRVSGQLVALASAQAAATAAQGVAESSSALTQGWWTVGGTAAGFLIALVLAWWLTGSQSRRIRRVSNAARTFAEHTMPDIVARMGARTGGGAPVDIEAEVGLADDGRDEIGALAAQLRAFGVQVLEQSERLTLAHDGWIRVVTGYANRIQVPVGQQFTLLAALQDQTRDPDQLDKLYRVDRAASTVNRFVTGMFVLSGTGLPLPDEPMPLERVITIAVQQTSRPAWFRRDPAPDVYVQPHVAILATHLLTELAENAVAVSSSDSPAQVRATTTYHGVAVEIEDPGPGQPETVLQRWNELMEDPPDFATMAVDPSRAVAGEDPDRPSMFRQGLFTVAHYAHEGGMVVRFDRGTWQGLRVVVTIPNHGLVEAPSTGGHSSWFDRPTTTFPKPTFPQPAIPHPALTAPWPDDDEDSPADQHRGRHASTGTTAAAPPPPVRTHPDSRPHPDGPQPSPHPPLDPAHLLPPLPQRPRGATLRRSPRSAAPHTHPHTHPHTDPAPPPTAEWLGHGADQFAAFARNVGGTQETRDQ